MTEQEMFAAWVEEYEYKAYPETNLLGTAPVCARTTVEERVEPYYSRWYALSWQLPDESEYGSPDPRFYTPTQALLDLQTRVEALRKKAFRTIPNPAYTDACAAEWERTRRKPFNQTKIQVGQSYTPQVSHTVTVGDTEENGT